MSNLNIFQNAAKSIPESDEQIVRVNMEEIEIGGRKSHLPAQHKEAKLGVSHVAAAGSNPGGK
jgi:hypothetical protein